jgi:hypothetical protein
MAYVAFSRSPIHVRETHGGVDPGYGNEGGPVDPGFGTGRPPVDPGYDRPAIGPIDPGFGVGLPPVDPGYGHPSRPDHIGGGGPVRPTYPVDPGYGFPSPPHMWPIPPRPLRPGHDLPGRPPHVGGGPAPGRPERPDQGLPPAPVHPSLPIYLPGPDNELPIQPGEIWPPMPPGIAQGKVMCFVWIVGIGYRWTVIDTSLKPAQPLPPTTVPPETPDNELPPAPAPKT